MYSPEQTGTRMAQRYDDTALAILAGEGILWPRVRDEQRTGLLARPPGYALYLVAVYETLGRSFLAAQLVQNVLTSIACVLLVLAAARLASWPIGVAAGFVAALSPQLGHVSALVLPDALSALPLLLALLLLARAHPDGASPWWTSATRRRPRRRGRLAPPQRRAAAAVPVARDPARFAGPEARPRPRAFALARGRPRRDPDHDPQLRGLRRVRARLAQRRPHAVAGHGGRRRPRAGRAPARHARRGGRGRPLRPARLPRLVGRARRHLAGQRPLPARRRGRSAPTPAATRA